MHLGAAILQHLVLSRSAGRCCSASQPRVYLPPHLPDPWAKGELAAGKKQVVWAEPWHCPSSVTKDRLGAAQYMVLKQLPPRQQKVSALTNLGFLPKTECNDPKSSFSSLVPCGCLFSASGSSSILKKIVAPWAWICPATSCPQHAPLPMSPGQLPGQQENIHRQESASGTPGWLQALSVGWCLP